MNLQIDDTAVLGARTHNGSVPNDLLEVIAGTTACSPMVVAGLLAWASLDAPHIPSVAPTDVSNEFTVRRDVLSQCSRTSLERTKR